MNYNMSLYILQTTTCRRLWNGWRWSI